MSLILDALRKSEGQRQRHAGPGLATVPERTEKQGPPAWTIAVAVLLGLNAVLVAVLVLRGGDDSAPTAPAERPARAAATTPPAPARPPAGRIAERVELPPPTRAEREEVRPLATELPAPEPSTSAPRPTASTSPEPVSSSATGTRETRPSAAPATRSVTQAGDDARLPRMSELVVQGALNVPAMHVDIHVYSGDPAERFVFINMRKYREGDATREGPTIERISETGVVMTYQGRRFVLPRD